MNDPYVVLGASPSDSKLEIRRRYLGLMLKHHPDKNPNNKEAATAMTKKIMAAWELLKGLASDKIQPLLVPAPPLKPRTALAAAIQNQELREYWVMWEEFDAECVYHFLARIIREATPANQQQYLENLTRDNDVLRKWSAARKDHESYVRSFVAIRDKVRPLLVPALPSIPQIARVDASAIQNQEELREYWMKWEEFDAVCVYHFLARVIREATPANWQQYLENLTRDNDVLRRWSAARKDHEDYTKELLAVHK